MKELDEEFKIIINQIEMTNDKIRNEFDYLLGEAEKQKILKRINKEGAQERKSGGGTGANSQMPGGKSTVTNCRIKSHPEGKNVNENKS